MIQSMTGYGKAKAILTNKEIEIEIKTLNSKNLDLNFRMPSAFKSEEITWRKLVSKHLLRGKVDVFLKLISEVSQDSVIINKEKIEYYIKQMQEITPLQSNKDKINLLEIAMKLPDVFSTNKDVLTDKDKDTVSNAISTAIHEVIEFREQEGKNLQLEINNYLEIIQNNLSSISNMDGYRVERVKQRLEKSLEELQIDYDKNRYEQELIYYLEKYDISEEITRLHSHINYFTETLKLSNSNGKKLNFICQEIGREINTIGSKANDAAMQNHVVEMKNQLEKIKEQSLNIL